MQTGQLDEVFQYHAPKEGQREKYERLRAAGKAFAAAILQDCPPCGDRDKALDFVRSGVFWANASVALEGIT